MAVRTAFARHWVLIGIMALLLLPLHFATSTPLSVGVSWPSSIDSGGTNMPINIMGGTPPYDAQLYKCSQAGVCAPGLLITEQTYNNAGSSYLQILQVPTTGTNAYYQLFVNDSAGNAYQSPVVTVPINPSTTTSTTVSSTVSASTTINAGGTTTIIGGGGTTGSTNSSQFAQNFCGGNANSTGGSSIIPTAPVIGTGTADAASVIGVTIAITLTVLLAMAILYMIGSVAGIERLKSTIRVEIVEAAATMLLIGLFFGGFFAAAFATQAGSGSTALAFGGPGRDVFVSDCSILTNASFSLVQPYLAFGTDSWLINGLASATVQIMPGGFGFQVSPFGGLKVITDTLGDVQGISGTLIVVVGAVVFFLGLIYSLFPLFLYLGIICRALPWTRAAGGILIAMFIGFYIIFPIMLNATLADFNHVTVAFTSNYTASNATKATGGFFNVSNATSTNSSLTTFTETLGKSGSGSGFFGFGLNQTYHLVTGYNDGYGILNEYIKVFIEPSLFVAIDVAFAFIVSLDITDLLADILGAPSLSAQRLVGKLL